MPLRTFTSRPKTGLFSAAVAALVAVSVQDLKPSSQDISAFYLANIYQILVDSNGSQVLIPPTLPNPSTPFSPPTSAVWVNSLWFLSLLISLTCALLATLLQQWARRYMKITQTRYSPHKRARIRAFFAEGVEKFHLPWAVEALPALLHLSLFLFFAGLAVFLFNTNHTVFSVAISWIGFCAGMYICITLMPMFRHDSPYYAPLSSSTWCLYVGVRFILFRILRWTANRYSLGGSIWQRARYLPRTHRQRILRGVEKEFETTALNAPSEIDGRALMWTYETLDEDHELEHFFAGIPGFCSSEVIDNPQSSLDSLRSEAVALGLNGFLERTWSSNLVSETTKIRRLVICIRAIDAAFLSLAAYEILDEFYQYRHALFQSIELGHSLINRGNNEDWKLPLFAQSIITCIVANVPVPQRNERWCSLTMHHLGISRHVLQGYLDHGDSVLLANLIHFTRQFVRNILMVNWERFPLFNILSRLRSKSNFQDALPWLRHDFCNLWNEVVLQERNMNHQLFSDILSQFSYIYAALHQGSTYNVSTLYPLCSIASHHVESAANINRRHGGRTAEMSHVPNTTFPVFHQHDPVSSAILPATEYHASPTSNLDHAIPHSADEQSRNGVLNNITSVASSLHPSLEDDRMSDDATADPIQGITDPSAIASMANPGSRSTSNHVAVSQPTRNVTAAAPSFVPDTVPFPIPLLTLGLDPVAPHISADPVVNQSGRSSDGELISLSSSKISTPVPLTPQVMSNLDPNTAGVEHLDVPDHHNSRSESCHTIFP